MSSDDAVRGRSVGRGVRTGRGSHSPVQEYVTPDRNTFQLEHIKMSQVKEIYEEFDEGTVLERTLSGRAFSVKKLEVSTYLWARQIFRGINTEKSMTFFTDAFHQAKDMAKRAGVQDPKKAWSNLEGSITRFHKKDANAEMVRFNFMKNFLKSDLTTTMFEPLAEYAKKQDTDAAAYVRSVYADMKQIPEDLVLGKQPKRVRRKKDVTLSSVTGSDSSSDSDSDGSDGDESDGDDDKNVKRKSKGAGPKQKQGRVSKISRPCGTRRSMRLAQKALAGSANKSVTPPTTTPDHHVNGVADRSPSRDARPADHSRAVLNSHQAHDSRDPPMSPNQPGPLANNSSTPSVTVHDFPPQTQFDDWIVRLHQNYNEMFDTEPPKLPTPSSSEYSADWCGNPPADNYSQFPEGHPVGAGYATLSSMGFSELHESAFEWNVTDYLMDATHVNGPSALDANMYDAIGEAEEIQLGEDWSLETSPLDDLFHEPHSPVKERCRAPSMDMGLDEEHVEKSRSTRSDNDMESLNMPETDVQLEDVSDKKKKKKTIWGRVKALFKRKKGRVYSVAPNPTSAKVEDAVTESGDVSVVRRSLKRRLSVAVADESGVSPSKRSREENTEPDESPLPSEYDMTIVRGHFHGYPGYFSDLVDPQMELPAESTPVPSEPADSTVSEDDAPRTFVRDVTITDSLEESLDLVHGVVDIVEHLINTVVYEAEGPQSQPSDSVLEFTRRVGQLLRVDLDLDASDPFDFIGDGRASELPKEK